MKFDEFLGYLDDTSLNSKTRSMIAKMNLKDQDPTYLMLCSICESEGKTTEQYKDATRELSRLVVENNLLYSVSLWNFVEEAYLLFDDAVAHLLRQQDVLDKSDHET